METDTLRRPGRPSAPAGRGRRTSLPAWRLLIVFAGVVLVVASLYWARAVLIPVALSLLLTFLLSPMVALLQRAGLGRPNAVILVVVVIFSVLGGVAWIITLQVTSLANDLPHYKDNIKQKVADLRGARRQTGLERVQETVEEVVGEIQKKEEPARAAEKPVPVVVQGPSLLRHVPSLLESLATAGLVIVLVVFMLVRREDLRNRLLRLVGYDRLAVTTRALDEASERISRYLLRQSIINGSFGTAVGVGLYLIGVPYAISWAFLAAALRFIPYVGIWIATLLPCALTLAVFPGWVQLVLVVVLFVALELLINMVMEPLLYGQSAGVSEVAILVAVAFWTWLWGPVGLVLATPLTVCLVVVGKYVPRMQFIITLIGDEPVMEGYPSYYQRLLAMDPAEAAEIVEEHLKTRSLEWVYDDLLLPALSCARRDRARGDLTEEEARFVRQATRRIIEDLRPRHDPSCDAEPSDGSLDDNIAAEARKARIVACPAQDEADELALRMFRQLLDPGRYVVEVASAAMLSSEMVSLVSAARPALVCIGALPPGGMAQARYLCKRLRARFPELPILVGRWGLERHREQDRELVLAAGAEAMSTSLLETRDQVMQRAPVVPPREARATAPSVEALRSA